MINPRDLQINSSYSYRTYYTFRKNSSVKILLEYTQEKAKEMFGLYQPTHLMSATCKATGKFPTWTHMVHVQGPALSETSDGSTLVIIWFSEFSPDTDRVLSFIEWEKYAKDYQNE